LSRDFERREFKMRRFGLLTLFTLVVLVAVAASAAPVTVSFAPVVSGVDNPWVVGTSYTSKTLLGGAITITTRVGLASAAVRYGTTGSGTSGTPLGLTVASTGEGIGIDPNRINYYGSSSETVTFNVDSLEWRIIGFVLDAFSYTTEPTTRESAQYSVDSAPWVYFQATSGNGGVEAITIPSSPIFGNFEIQAAGPAANFAIRSITLEQVLDEAIPEPGTFLLLGGGLLALGFAGRRFRRG
jgi:hypothetical protein